MGPATAAEQLKFGLNRRRSAFPTSISVSFPIEQQRRKIRSLALPQHNMSKSSNEESGGEATTSESRKALGAARPKHESCTSDGLSQEIAMSDDDGVTAAAESLVMASAEMGGRFSRFHSKAMFDTMDKEDQASSISRKRSKSPLSSANLSKGKRSAKPTSSKGAAGRWTKEEHEAFLEGLNIHGREWKKVAERITTRTSAQVSNGFVSSWIFSMWRCRWISVSLNYFFACCCAP